MAVAIMLGGATMHVAAQPIATHPRGAVERPIRHADRLESEADTGPRLMSAPVLGLFTNDSHTEVRSITGVPGSALVSVPLQLPENVGRVFLAPSQRWAVVEKADASGFAFLPFNGETAGRLIDVEASAKTADLVSFSPSGLHAIIFSRQDDRLQVIANESGIARVKADLGIAGVVAGNVSLIAIDENGASPVVVTDLGGTYRIGLDTVPVFLFQGAAITAVGYRAGRTDLFIADSGASQISILENLLGAPLTRVLTTGLGDPGARIWMQASQDGRTLFASIAESKRVWRIDVNTSAVQTLDLPATPIGLERLRNGNSFLFSASAGEAAWILLGDAVEMRAVFAANVVRQNTGPKGEVSRRR